MVLFFGYLYFSFYLLLFFLALSNLLIKDYIKASADQSQANIANFTQDDFTRLSKFSELFEEYVFKEL